MRIIVFQQGGSGAAKLAAIREHGNGLELSDIIDLPLGLPDFIDDPAPFFPSTLQADLAISFLRHPDLLDHLADICDKFSIPLIAAGAKNRKAITPPTCCSLGRLPGLGRYGELFGFPEYAAEVRDNVITALQVIRGASCGASWGVCQRLIGMSTAAALECCAREVQYLCVTDPSDFDPVSGKSALHIAGNVHAKALARAIEQACRQ